MLPYDGLKAMAEGGIVKAVSCAVLVGAKHAESYFDHFRQNYNFYRQWAGKEGVELYTAVGVHPAGIPDDWTKVIDKLPEFLAEPSVVALGEVGMNNDNQLERDVLKAQMEVAKACNKPLIIHTPNQNRQAFVDLYFEMAQKVGISPQLLVIDHAMLDIIDQINEFGAVPGITIRKQHVLPEELLENLDRYASGMLNCDYSNIFQNDPTGVIKAAKYLQEQNVDPQIIENLTYKKAAQVFNIED
ncbi:MAG: TatD family hydrolase [Desulfotomaculum sp.]|nr:TatD family hydrolase [Desulfotomaculum sp.]